MESWRDRLKLAMKKKRRSMRDVSLKCNKSEGYIASILKNADDQRDPSVEAIIKIANEVGVSLAWLLDGVELTGDAAKLLRSFSELAPDQQEALQRSAEAMKPREMRPPESTF